MRVGGSDGNTHGRTPKRAWQGSGVEWLIPHICDRVRWGATSDKKGETEGNTMNEEEYPWYGSMHVNERTRYSRPEHRGDYRCVFVHEQRFERGKEATLERRESESRAREPREVRECLKS